MAPGGGGARSTPRAYRGVGSYPGEPCLAFWLQQLGERNWKLENWPKWSGSAARWWASGERGVAGEEVLMLRVFQC